MLLILLPISSINCVASGPKGPNVSAAIGIKWKSVRWLYLILFLCSANSAAFPASVAECCKYEAHVVSTQVKSQANGLPSLYGNVVMPSGRFLSVAKSPFGSEIAANSAVVSALWIRLLALLCLAFLPRAALSHLRPCLPNWSTFDLPQIQGCGRQIGAPSLSAQAILKQELFSLRARFSTGTDSNQCEACFAETAFNLAISSSEVYEPIKFSNLASQRGLSHSDWAVLLDGMRSAELDPKIDDQD